MIAKRILDGVEAGAPLPRRPHERGGPRGELAVEVAVQPLRASSLRCSTSVWRPRVLLVVPNWSIALWIW